MFAVSSREKPKLHGRKELKVGHQAEKLSERTVK